MATLTATDTTTALCADDACTHPDCNRNAPASEAAPTEAEETAAKRNAFRPYTRLMSDTTRRQRAEKYPNPETVPIADFLAACREEARDRDWCGTAQSMVNRIRVGENLRLTARHPQWNPAMGDGGEYDSWAINPQLTEAGITTIASAEIVQGVQAVIDAGYNDNGYRLGMDNILSKVWCTFVPPPQPTWRVKVEVDITSETARANGYTLSRANTAHDQEYVIRNVLRRMINDGTVTPTWEVTTV